MRKRTTIGASLAFLLLALPFPGAGGGKKDLEPSVVAGTVFREPGFALPRATLTLTVRTPPQAVKAPKAQKTVSDGRGEFMFRVPGAKAGYLLSVSADGFLPQEKPVAVSGPAERQDVYFELKPDRK
jgi:hypothetical protein